MVPVFLMIVLFVVILTFIVEKTKFFRGSPMPLFLGFVAGLLTGTYLNNHCLIYLIPSDSNFKIERKEPLQKIGRENIFIATSSGLSIDKNKIKINFLKEGDRGLSERVVNKKNIILTRDNGEASIISTIPKRKGFLGLFVMYHPEHKYYVPESGIKEGKIVSLLFEFLPDKR